MDGHWEGRKGGKAIFSRFNKGSFYSQRGRERNGKNAVSFLRRREKGGT